MDRRMFLAGVLASSAISAIPFRHALEGVTVGARAGSLDATVVRDLVEAVRVASAAKLPEGTWHADLEVFEAAVKGKMERWGTLQPLKQMELISQNKETGEWTERRLINMWMDPNFGDQGTFLGLSNGFTTSFKLPGGEKVKVTYFSSYGEARFYFEDDPFGEAFLAVPYREWRVPPRLPDDMSVFDGTAPVQVESGIKVTKDGEVESI